jgi:hypothetical protein
MVRNNFRILEQKINAHEKLSNAEKFDIQHYMTRCYGSMTGFNKEEPLFERGITNGRERQPLIRILCCVMNFNRSFWWLIAVSSVCLVLAVFGFRGWDGSSGDVNWFSILALTAGCGGFAVALMLLVVLLEKHLVSVPARLVFFGCCAGLVWSLAPGILDKLFYGRGVVPTLIASVLTGVFVSMVLYRPLENSGVIGAFCWGLLALPIGSFCFGVFLSVILIVASICHRAAIPPGNDLFMPLKLGEEYAVFSLITVCAYFLFPLAVITSFVLRAFARYKLDRGATP